MHLVNFIIKKLFWRNLELCSFSQPDVMHGTVNENVRGLLISLPIEIGGEYIKGIEIIKKKN